MAGGLIIAAPASGSGKTTLTLGLVRALRQRGIDVGVAKAGPDYIDAGFLAAAAGTPCHNLDTWGMGRAMVAGAARALEAAHDIVVCEGVMGLFDGAHTDPPTRTAPGSTAALAAATGWPVVLVVDGRRQAGSLGALVHGFAGYDPAVTVAAVIVNQVASDKHAAMARGAVALGAPDAPVLGCVARDPALALPSRHLGLVQAGETDDLEGFIAGSADAVAAQVDVDAVHRLARGAPDPDPVDSDALGPMLPPIGQRIAVARDAAFSFCYAAVIDGWRAAGATVVPFAPLNDEAPDGDADAVYLPGGYPELHAGRLAQNRTFVAGVRAAAARGAVVWGECGGYMVLGEGLQDAAGDWHDMTGLLPLRTSMTDSRLRLGYREIRLRTASGLGPAGRVYRGHEFHHARVVAEGPGEAMAEAWDAAGAALGPCGLVAGRVAGSFLHLMAERRAADG